MTMFRNAATKTIPLIIRAAVLGSLLVGPVLAVPAMSQDRSLQIEAPSMKKMGAGFVLMVSLQRR